MKTRDRLNLEPLDPRSEPFGEDGQGAVDMVKLQDFVLREAIVKQW